MNDRRDFLKSLLGAVVAVPAVVACGALKPEPEPVELPAALDPNEQPEIWLTRLAFKNRELNPGSKRISLSGLRVGDWVEADIGCKMEDYMRLRDWVDGGFLTLTYYTRQIVVNGYVKESWASYDQLPHLNVIGVVAE